MDPSIHFDNSCALDSVLFLDSAIYSLKNWTLEDNVLFDVYEIPKFINNSWKKKPNEFMTVKEVWICDPNYRKITVNFYFEFL